MDPLYDVVGIGRAYTDIVATVTAGFLEKHGLPADSGKAVTTEALSTIQKDLPNFDLLQGGSVANSLAGLSAQGGNVALFVKVADDAAGRAFLDDCAARKINVLGPAPCQASTTSAQCLVLVTENGQRSFAFNQGCADAFSADDFRGFDFALARYFLVEGHILTGTASSILIDVMRAAKKTACKIVISLSDISSWDGRAALVHTIAELADLIIANDSERAAFDALVKAPLRPTQIAVTTHGAKGASASQGSFAVHVDAVPPSIFKNTVGAGDQFTAGFLRGLSLGFDLEKSMQLGAATAAAILQETGARPQRA